MRIHLVGEVAAAVNTAQGEVRIRPLRIAPFSLEAPKIGADGNWFWALSEVTNRDAIRAIFAARPAPARIPGERGPSAEPLFGDKLYQGRARAALPLLVNLAQRGEKIYYKPLADALEMSNPRNLDYVLGCIGQTLLLLGRNWKDKIPPIETLVINQADNLPGPGAAYFIGRRYRDMSKPERRDVIDNKIHPAVWDYQKWGEVLSTLWLRPPSGVKARQVQRKGLSRGGGYGNWKENRFVEQAAVKYVTRSLRKKGYRVKSREKDGKGYDLDAMKGKTVLHIEVKGVSGKVQQFQITSGERNFAARNPNARLFVVTMALTSPKLHRHNGCDIENLFRFDATAFRATPK